MEPEHNRVDTANASENEMAVWAVLIYNTEVVVVVVEECKLLEFLLLFFI